MVSIEIEIPHSFLWKGEMFSRAEFFDFLWKNFGATGLTGIHEGSVLTEDVPNSEGEENSGDPWVLDSGIAPESRDWVGDSKALKSNLYFEDQKKAQAVVALMKVWSLPFLIPDPVDVIDQDWNKKWRDSFQGVWVDPCWYVHPPWAEIPEEINQQVRAGQVKIIELNPGAGFGTGTHETTGLCLEFLAGIPDFGRHQVLDFGSGSGILAIAAALSGAVHVDGVEIDDLALDNAAENSALNHLCEQIRFSKSIPQGSSYSVIVANILRPVLVAHAKHLIEKFFDFVAGAPKDQIGLHLILSGLIESDVEEVRAVFDREIERRWGDRVSVNFKQKAKQEWRALAWQIKGSAQ